MKQEILLRKANTFVVRDAHYDPSLLFGNNAIAATVQAELMNLGYMLSKTAYETISTSNQTDVADTLNEILPILNKLRGSHVVHKPMYKNFPQEVIDMSIVDLYLNAIVHYWTAGHWMPESTEVLREFGFETTKYTMLDCADGLEATEILGNVIGAIAQSKESISEADKAYVEYYISEGFPLGQLDFQYKENMCLVIGALFENGRDVTDRLRTPTDILRFVTYLSDGDVSLSENCKFKSLSRKLRRQLVTALEECINDDDIARHDGKWKRLFHSLHIGEYAKIAPKSVATAEKVRNNEHLSTFNSKVEAAIKDLDVINSVELLRLRPGEFHRRLDHLLRTFVQDNDYILDEYGDVVSKVSTRLLIQLAGHLRQRETSTQMYVFPKGSTQKGLMFDRKGNLKKDTIVRLTDIVKTQIIENFKDLPDLGKVWIDPNLKECPLPTQQRSASEGLVELARGTKFEMGEKDFLRFFVYWKGMDIDLSATFHNDKFEMIDQVSYTRLRSDGPKCFHSGDITRAPNGASEFIDVEIDKAAKCGYRYVVMNVLVFSGPTFKEHDEVFAGWMTLDQPGKNGIFAPKQVQQKIDLTADTRNVVPVVFDLKERKVIWTDIQSNQRLRDAVYRANNVESNRVGIEKSLEIIANRADTQFTLYELFASHAIARGETVDNPEDADVCFGFTTVNQKCDVTPFDINTINSEYI